MQVVKCHKVCISAHGIQIPSLLDSSSGVTLLQQSYFNKHILPKIKLAMGEKADAHTLFKLTPGWDRAHSQQCTKTYPYRPVSAWGQPPQILCQV